MNDLSDFYRAKGSCVSSLRPGASASPEPDLKDQADKGLKRKEAELDKQIEAAFQHVVWFGVGNSYCQLRTPRRLARCARLA